MIVISHIRVSYLSNALRIEHWIGSIIENVRNTNRRSIRFNHWIPIRVFYYRIYREHADVNNKSQLIDRLARFRIFCEDLEKLGSLFLTCRTQICQNSIFAFFLLSLSLSPALSNLFHGSSISSLNNSSNRFIARAAWIDQS